MKKSDDKQLFEHGMLKLSKSLKIPAQYKKQGFQDFLKNYLSRITQDDIIEYPAEKLINIALHHWKLAQKRKRDAILIEIFNPETKAHGWQSKHTGVCIIVRDMPFLVDTSRMLFDRLDIDIHFSINTPQLYFERDSQGAMKKLLTKRQPKCLQEAFIYFEINRQSDPKVIQQIYQSLVDSLEDVAMAVDDWQAMQDKVREQINMLDDYQSTIDSDLIAESQGFLKWLLNGHFIFLGAREYKAMGKGSKHALHLIPENSLGLLRDTRNSKLVRYYDDLPAKAKKMAHSRQMLITMPETNTRSTVHRPTYTICVAVKILDKKGAIKGEQRFIGLYTSSVYYNYLSSIPLLRKKYDEVLRMANYPREAYAGKALAHIIETLPRDELFQLDIKGLYDLSMGILDIQERRKVSFFMRKDSYERYCSCFVFIPRDNFNATVMNLTRDCLMRHLNGTEVNFTTHFFETGLVRLHYIVRIDPKKKHRFNAKEIEKEIMEIGTSWYDGFNVALSKRFAEEEASKLLKKYRDAFSLHYQNQFSAQESVSDVALIEHSLDQQALVAKLELIPCLENPGFSLKIYHKNDPIHLSDIIPILENFGFQVLTEVPYFVNRKGEDTVMINDFHVTMSTDLRHDFAEVRKHIENACFAIWKGQAEDDRYNGLILKANMNWQQVTILRMYGKYLRQIGFRFSQDYIADVLCKQPDLASTLVDFFMTKFDPDSDFKKDNGREERCAQLEATFNEGMAQVATLDEDRILRKFFEVIKATVRTNMYQSKEGKPYYSYKLSSKDIPDLKEPVPMFEFFVYSPKHNGHHSGFEGVHIRFSTVARGGIRISKRREDYRQEVLDLATTQDVKNSLIVPSGAKGGFVPYFDASTTSRDDAAKENVSCYRDYIRGMLDLTDNIVKGKTVKPERTLCYDKSDTYFVVAADRGTATYSDEANHLSHERGFWLDDAFASGGSEGYDHKKIGITAKGAWESVKHHFSALNVDINKTDFSVAGIGDMSGDVFGNGMLLSKHILLKAAFNHVHIFIDPNPNAAKSYKERERLFKLPGSAWTDYNQKLISKGGGIFSRFSKSIPLSSEMKKMFNTDQGSVTPVELVRMILAMRVDLLWNGGIGTYVKASHETNAQAHDRSNNAVRINADQMKAKIVAEGGNLGLTQSARIQYESCGGLINTDFIDNSAGVDCSDHEVNIKIMLNQLVQEKKLSCKQRNTLLRAMTDEVSDLVLSNNRRQNQSITVAAQQSVDQSSIYRRYLTYLMDKQIIDRRREILPSDNELNDRQKNHQGMRRAEISVLMAKTKNHLKNILSESRLCTDDLFTKLIFSAFPSVLAEKYKKQILGHKLRTQLVATQLSNLVVDEMGLIFVYQLHEQTSKSMLNVLKAYLVCREIFALPEILEMIDAHEDRLPREQYLCMREEYVEFVKTATQWFLHTPIIKKSCSELVSHFKKPVFQYESKITNYLSDKKLVQFNRSLEDAIKMDFTEKQAKRLASLPFLLDALKVIGYADYFLQPIHTVATLHNHLMYELNIQSIVTMVEQYEIEDHWTAAAIINLKKKLDYLIQRLIGEMISTKAKNPQQKTSDWDKANIHRLERWHDLLEECQDGFANSQSRLATLSVVISMLGQFSKKKRK